jgi:elongation factor G
MAHRPEDVRTVALVGAGGAGKTTLVEALLFKAKAISRRGSVPERNTVTDYDPDEKERQHSILATPVHLPWDGKHVQVIDTPGALDFVGEALPALAAVEMAVVCVNAHDGIPVATRRLWKAIRASKLPACVLVTRFDMENVDREALYDQIQQAFGNVAVPINLPDAVGSGASKVVDVFGADVPAGLKDEAAEYRTQATERVIEIDTALTEKYLEGGEVTTAELEKAFPEALRQGTIVPILHVSVDKDIGLKKFLDFLVHDAPKPHRVVVRKAVKADGSPAKVDPAGRLSGQVWKVLVDPHVGKMAYLRVWSGTLQGKTQLTIARTGEATRIGDLLEVQGKDTHAVPSASAGDLVAVAKVDALRIGDTVHDGSADWTFVPIDVPVPKVTLAIEPKNRGDEAKLGPELAKLAEGDPTFVAEREESTHQMVVRGMSSLHVDILLKRLARRKVEVVTKTPRVPYRETVGAKAEAAYRHKKQTGGRGQFAEVHLRVEPRARGEGFEFVDEVVGGTIPRQFIPAVEKGILEVLPKGVFAGYPFTDVRAIVHFGKYHDVDSDEFSFKLAAGQCFKEAVQGARPVLLEPVMEVEIEVPSRFMGDISGDLNSRRGRIQGMTQEGDVSVIQAEVPLSEMQSYSTELRSITAGEGDFTFKFGRYETVPPQIAQEIVAKHKKENEAGQA